MSKIFIVVEPDPVVSMDIESLLSGRYPDATVLASAKLEANDSKKRSFGPDTTLFVRGALVSRDEELAKFLRIAATRGSKIVTLGKSTRLDIPVTTIELPFTTDMVIAAVETEQSSDGSDSHA